MHQTTANSSPALYRNSLSLWDRVASVRIKPRRILLNENILEKSFWLPELAPVSSHPFVVEKELSNDILTQHLYLHLDFTIRLEQDIVNPAVCQIAHRNLCFSMPEEMIFDAYRIYCDEAYHALFYADFKSQVESFTGIKPISLGTPTFLRKFQEIQDSQPKIPSQLIKIFFVIVSETLISSVLKKIPKDEFVVEEVRQIIHDHACDEAYHSIYFANLFKVVWHQLEQEQQILIGKLLPEFIKIFLEPDFDSLKLILSSLGLTSENIFTIITESYPQRNTMNNIRSSAKNTLTLLWHSGLFENSQLFEAFRISNLLPNEMSDEHIVIPFQS